MQYFVEMKVGSNLQPLNFLIDTSSSVLIFLTINRFHGFRLKNAKIARIISFDNLSQKHFNMLVGLERD